MNIKESGEQNMKGFGVKKRRDNIIMKDSKKKRDKNN